MRTRYAAPPLAAAISALLATAACTFAGPATPPLSQSQLTARLLTASAVLAGFAVDPIGPGPPADTPGPTPTGPPGCQHLTAAADFMQTVQTPTAHATEIITGTGALGLRWTGAEDLYSYPGDTAPHILNQLRALAPHCPNGASTDPPVHLTTADAPHLGDDSLLLKIRTTHSPQLAMDALLIRTGTTILVISETFTPADDTTASPLEQLAAHALTAYNAPPAKPAP